MYGVINQAIEKMIVDNYGQETWNRIKKEAQTGHDVFITMDTYPDDITLKLVGGACKVLGAAPADVLTAFGNYYIDYVGEKFGDLFDMSGTDFFELVQNLNNLHTRVAHMMPELKPPIFKLTDITPNSFVLHYKSPRADLYPLVLGLLQGLGRRYRTEVDANLLRGTTDGLDHDEIKVIYTPL